jgi:hypothetical protein
MPKNYWMLSLTGENYLVTQKLGFSVQGFRVPHHKKIKRMLVGDRLLIYVQQLSSFTTTLNITSEYFEDHSKKWTYINEREDFSLRVNIEASCILKEGEYIDANILAPRMQFIKNWRPEDWHLAFQGDLHLIPKNDFILIEDEMQRLIDKRPGKSHKKYKYN